MLSFKFFYKTLLISFISICSISSLHAATISFSSNSLTVNPGDSFSLTIKGSGFPTIVGGGLNINFDASVLQINQVTINQSVFEFYLGNGVEEGSLNNATGNLLDTAFNTATGATGNFNIMAIDFTAIGSGSSQLFLSESSIWVFSNEFGQRISNSISYEMAQIDVTAVPLPAAIWLFGSGLLLLLNMRRHSLVS